MEKLFNEQKIFELQKELQQARENLTVAEKRNEVFLELAVHDLKSPLRKITTLLQMLTDKAKHQLPDDLLIYVNRLNRSLNETNAIVESFVILNELDNHSLIISDIDVTKIVVETAKRYSTVHNDLQLEVNLESCQPISSDSSLLQKLFEQLFSNSIKFRSEDRPLSISISSAELSEHDFHLLRTYNAEKYYRIDFCDNGIGFSQEDASQVFYAFNRLNGKSDFKGIGLGLSIAKKISKLLGACIYAEKNAEYGGRIVLLLPQSL